MFEMELEARRQADHELKTLGRPGKARMSDSDRDEGNQGPGLFPGTRAPPHAAAPADPSLASADGACNDGHLAP